MPGEGEHYTDAQIIGILREVESGKIIVSVCREYGVSEVTVHRWRNKYRGMGQSQLRELKELRAENCRLRKLVAQQVQWNKIPQDGRWISMC